MSLEQTEWAGALCLKMGTLLQIPSRHPVIRVESWVSQICGYWGIFFLKKLIFVAKQEGPVDESFGHVPHFLTPGHRKSQWCREEVSLQCAKDHSKSGLGTQFNFLPTALPSIAVLDLIQSGGFDAKIICSMRQGHLDHLLPWEHVHWQRIYLSRPWDTTDSRHLKCWGGRLHKTGLSLWLHQDKEPPGRVDPSFLLTLKHFPSRGLLGCNANY